MGKYKISLLTAVSDDNSSYFLPTVLGYANEQIKYEHDYEYIDKSTQQLIKKNVQGLTAHKNEEQSLCYTYNEKYAQHQNAQKELTFSMDRKILMHDEWLTNPHTAHLHIGSVIELEDKYNNTILFIVKKIQYTFKEHNITYNYTCQDAFSYQYTRQQSGYTIKNDAASEDFIGSKTIDWWVIKKIVPECYIKYEYVPLQLGLYKDGNNKISTFTESERKSWTDGTRIILKEPFTNSEFQTPIIFSCSGSNANAALISLGEKLDLMIHSCEIKQEGNSNNYRQLFWYEPKQNQDVTGLKYSPKTQISNFGLDFAGDSLTTVLNVNSHELGDDLVTLIPKTPSIFTNFFMTKEWLDSKYYPGFFTDFISGKQYKYTTNIHNSTNNTLNIDISSNKTLDIVNIYNEQKTVEHFLSIKISNTDDSTNHFTLPLLYNLYEDNWEDENETYISYVIGESVYGFSGRENHLYLLIRDPEQKPDENYFYIIREDAEIPDHLRGKTLEVYLGIPRATASTDIHITNASIYLRFYRDFTGEEKAFAEIADQCPWLENRLIDFSYFLEQNIISRQEYEFLMNLLQNDLRIINGKLLFLNDAYYAAVRKKREILSNLTNQLDALGAAIEAEVVTPLLNGQQPEDLESTLKSYSSVFNLSTDSNQILNYNELLSEYFEKYFSAEQRFLENVYAFKKYFNEPCTFSYNKDAGIYTDTLTASVDSDNFIAFGQPTFSVWDGQDEAPLFYHEGTKYTPAILINETNKTEFYKPLIEKAKFIKIDPNTSPKELFDFCQNNSYWISESDYKKYFSSIQRDDTSIEKYFDENKNIYYKLSTTELKRLIIANNPDKYYLRNKSTYIDFNDVRKNFDLISSKISWITLPNLLKYWEANNDEGQNICKWKENPNDKDSFFWNYYKAFFPINEIYYKGPVIKTSSSIITNDDGTEKTKWTFASYNEKGEKDNTTTYQTYQPIYFAGNGSLLSDWGSCSNEAAVAAKEKIESSWSYSAFNYSPKAIDVVGEVITGVAGYLINPWIGIIGTAVAAISGTYHALCDENWCQWLNNANAYRSFEGEGSIFHQLNSRAGSAIMHTDISGINSTFYNYDSYYANYGTSSEAASQYITQTALWNDILYQRVSPANIKAITWYQNYLDSNKIDTDTTDLNEKIDYNFYEYHNFYKYIVASYSFRYDSLPGKLFVKDKSFRILSKNSKLNRYDSYIRIPVYENTNSNTILNDLTEDKEYEDSPKEKKPTLLEHKQLIYIKDPEYFTQHKIFSALTWYPLYSTAKDINISNLNIWKEKENITLEDLIKLSIKDQADKISYTIDDKGLVTFSSSQSNENKMSAKYLYAHVENYYRSYFDDNADQYDGNIQISNKISSIDKYDKNGNLINAIQNLSEVYLIDDDRAINPLKESGSLKLNNLLIPLYTISEKDNAMIKIDPVDNINKLRCYRVIVNKIDINKNPISYERVYSREQIRACLGENATDTEYCTITTARKFMYIKNTSMEFVNFTPNNTEFIANIYLCKRKLDSDGNIKITSQKYEYNSNTDNPLKIEGGSKTLILKDANGEEYSSTITLVEDKKESLINISNGTFWYRYRTRIEWPTLAEYAAVIETQLQTYWDQAYTASKYCKYFLPKYWQPTDSNTKNAFAKDIIVPIFNDNNNVIGVSLSNTYLPEVDIYKNDKYENFKYKHYLTKYIWNYRPNTKPSIEDLNDNESIIAQQESANNIKANTVSILVDNQFISDIMNHLNTNLSDWEVSENGYMIYYYQSGEKTGMLWSDLISEKVPSMTLDRVDGLYGMMFYLLKNNYTTNSLSEYESIKKQKETIWNNIYTQYPFLLLEDNYKYELATNSEELLKMAKLVFKGKKQPEKGYSVNIIDTRNLEGYIGQELKPGQGIEINASEYYDENDDIYKALSQYLFITDINYSLRDDTNISITVNSIKYQEKLLQSLVKLIR